MGIRDLLLHRKAEVPHVSDLTHIDCQGLAGHWTYATGQAGFNLVHRASLGKFGDQVIESNRALVPGPWEQDTGAGLDEWTPMEASYLTGTPPCSGFSTLNKSKKSNARGPDSRINDCMWELVRYAGRCTGSDGQRGPQVVSFESVQAAFTSGRVLMQALRAELEKLTKQKYDLTHVLMSGASVGSAQMRKRYYFVLHRIPFGVDQPEKIRVATYKDAIGDLLGLKDQWEPQFIIDDSWDQTWWLRENQLIDSWSSAPRVVDAQIGAFNPKVRIMLEELEPYWPAGKDLEVAMRNYREANKHFPEGAAKWWRDDTDTLKGFAHPTRVHPDKPGYVCTGNCTTDFIHYKEPRMLTVRECSRLMGLPDSWTWESIDTVTKAGMYIGKCCPVQSGKWISSWVRRAVEGNPGEKPAKIGEREYMHNSTLLFTRWLKEQQSV